MTKLYIDCAMGAAGDMLTAALVGLTAEPYEYIDKLNSMKIPGIEFVLEPKCQKNTKGFHINVFFKGKTEEIESCSQKDADSDCFLQKNTEIDCSLQKKEEKYHVHRTLSDIYAIIDEISTENAIKNDIKEIYSVLAEAESHAHGVKVSEIHFHEVGMMDAIADIAAVCFMMRELAPDRIICSPVNVGNGKVKCAHGILPVPAPATACILEGIPSYSPETAVLGELCTPTGAALLKYWADEFVSDKERFEQLTDTADIVKTGRGMGTRVFEDMVNCVSIYREDGV